MGLFKRKSPEEKAADEVRSAFRGTMEVLGGAVFMQIYGGDQADEHALERMRTHVKGGAVAVLRQDGPDAVRSGIDVGEQALRQQHQMWRKSFVRRVPVTLDEAVAKYHKIVEDELSEVL